ncbi:MAG: Gfo/Idh/MocA family oxidoreductase [Caldilineaceae bacterium]
MSSLTVGILGLGQGQSHLQAFQSLEGSRVLAVCDQDAALAQRMAQRFNVPQIYTRFEQLLEDKTLDILVIATPDHTHGQFAIQALEAGKHVLSEIPMATTLDEVRRIIELSERSGLKYHMGNQVRYAFCLQDVQRLIAAGDFGELFYGEGEYLHDMEDIAGPRGPDHWRIQRSLPQTTMLGGGPHAIDTLRWLMNARFVEVQAFHASQQTRWGTGHTTVALFKTDNGGVTKITVSYGMQRPYCLYYSVYGTAGSFERTRDQGGPMQETTNYLYHSRLSGTQRMIPVTLSNWNNPKVARRFALGHGTMEIEQAQDFLTAIRSDREPAIGPREAARSIAAAICALQSADAGGGVVKIPEF